MDRSADANGFARKGRWGLIAAATAIACVSLAPAGAQAAAKGSSTQCPGTFTVLHDDSIGALKLTAGRYVITVLTEQTLSCQKASKLFARFLRRPGRRPPQPLAPQRRTRPSSARAPAPRAWPSASPSSAAAVAAVAVAVAAVAVATAPSARPSRCSTTTASARCDPGRNYLITAKNMGCPSASQQFAKFLQSPSGRLGGGWQLKPRKAKFRNPNTGESFRIKQQ